MKTYALYYTSNRMQGSLLWNEVQSRILTALSGTNIELLSSSRTPIEFGSNIAKSIDGGFSPERIAKQILVWLEKLDDDDFIYMLEDDVLYSASHFDSTRVDKSKVNSNFNCFRSSPFGYHLQSHIYTPMSMMSGPAILIKNNLYRFLRGESRGIEPLMVLGFYNYTQYFSDVPCIDIRHQYNTTQYNPFFSGMCQTLAHWGSNSELRARLGLDRQFAGTPKTELTLSIQPEQGCVSMSELIAKNELDKLKNLMDGASSILYIGSRSALGNLVLLYDIL